MTDPLRGTFDEGAVPPSFDPGAGPSDEFTAPSTTTTDPTSSTATKTESLTPLYAAAGLAEVVMTSLRSRLAQAQAQAKGSPAAKGRVAELQQQLRNYRDQVASGYTSLANRGKPAVDSTLVTVRHLSGRVERKAEDLQDAATPSVTQPSTADQVPPVVVQPVVVDPTDTDRTPGTVG